MICHGIETGARSTEIVGAWRDLRTRQSATAMLRVGFHRATYISAVTSGTDALGLCTECTFDIATLTLGFQVCRDPFRQRSDFCECGFADIAFEQVCGKGESHQCEKRCATKD